MRERHVTAAMLRRLHRQELEPAELLSVVRHLQDCAGCALLADDALPPRLQLEDDPGNESRHLDAETQLFPWVDGALAAADREIVESHLEDCEICRAEADDLRRLRTPVRRAPRGWWAIAAGVVVAMAGLIAVRRAEPPEMPPSVARPAPSAPSSSAIATYTNPEWSRLVADVVRTQRLPLAEGLDELRPPADPLRGPSESNHRSLVPAGVVVADVRPRFTWAPIDNATYVVSVFAGASEVAASDVLETPSWTPMTELPQERTLTWQVEVTREGKRFIMPAPPAPPALFRVASSEMRAEIEAARTRHPGDQLLHAILYARAGLVAEADAALRRAVAAGDRRAAAIARP